MDGRDPTAAENQRYAKSVVIGISYRAGEILHSQQDLTTAVFITSNLTFVQQVQIKC